MDNSLSEFVQPFYVPSPFLLLLSALSPPLGNSLSVPFVVEIPSPPKLLSRA